MPLTSKNHPNVLTYRDKLLGVILRLRNIARNVRNLASSKYSMHIPRERQTSFTDPGQSLTIRTVWLRLDVIRVESARRRERPVVNAAAVWQHAIERIPWLTMSKTAFRSIVTQGGNVEGVDRSDSVFGSLRTVSVGWT